MQTVSKPSVSRDKLGISSSRFLESASKLSISLSSLSFSLSNASSASNRLDAFDDSRRRGLRGDGSLEFRNSRFSCFSSSPKPLQSLSFGICGGLGLSQLNARAIDCFAGRMRCLFVGRLRSAGGLGSFDGLASLAMQRGHLVAQRVALALGFGGRAASPHECIKLFGCQAFSYGLALLRFGRRLDGGVAALLHRLGLLAAGGR